jgi:hypothetical protein
MDEEERHIITKLQAKANSEWKDAKLVPLDGPGPFELPLCGMNVSSHILPPGKLVLVLETAKHDQRVLVPITAAALPSLKSMIDFLVMQLEPSEGAPN